MTRVNVVEPSELHDLHLLAEYRELPRVFALAERASKDDAWRKRQPEAYTLGTGHVLFFYDKLRWLSKRHKQLVREMQHRGFNPKFTESLEVQWRPRIPAPYWRDYKPTEEARTVNRERIDLRLKNMKGGRGWIKSLPFFV